MVQGVDGCHHDQHVLPDIPLRMELGGLWHTFQGCHLRQHIRQQARIEQQIKPTAAPTFCPDPRQFIPNALGADVFDHRRRLHQLGPGVGLQAEAQARGEAHSAQRPQAILGKTRCRIPDRANQPVRQVLLAADVIDEPAP